jgi:iron complex transport system permease protein
VRASFAVVASFLALAVAMALGVALGSGAAGLADIFGGATSAHAIVVGYRLPRVLLGAVAGAGLAAIAAGAGAAPIFAAAGVPAASFAGGAAATALVWALGRAEMRGRAETGAGASILLAGVVINSIAYACILFVEALAEPEKLQALVWWLMGYLDAPTWPRLAFVSVYTAGGLAILLADAARINVLSLGDEPAYSLGIDVRALERRALFACALVVGAVVSVAGPIGFVGLVVPQGVRRVVGPDLRVLMPTSILVGAATLVTCDLAVRVLAPVLHTEVPVGAVTALLGGPLFLVLLSGRGK